MNQTNNPVIAAHVQACEKRLLQAMLASDIAALDQLLAQDLIFTNHLGQLMTKQDDLDAHKSGTVKITSISLSEQKINTYGDVAIVTVRAHIAGSFAGEEAENSFRFTRVWSQTPNSKASEQDWQVIAGHSCIKK